MEQWLKDHLVTSGVMTPGGFTRAAKVKACPKCGRYVFRGLDADVMATEATAELAPLSPFGELVALTGGLRTYELRYAGGRYELGYREADEIKAHPAGSTPGVDVVSQHKCGIDIAHTCGTAIYARKPKPSAISDEPPF